MKVLILLALVAVASARPQFFPFHNPVVTVKSADPTNFPVAHTYTATYPNPNTYTIPSTYNIFPATYSTIPSNFNTFPNVYSAIPTTYNTGTYPFTFNPIVNPTDQKVRSKRSADEPNPEPQTSVVPVTTAIHYPTTYANPNTFPTTYTNPNALPTTYTIPNTFPATYTIPNTVPATYATPNSFPTTYTIPNAFPTTYNFPNTYNYPATTGYNFPIGVTNPAFVNPYTSALTYYTNK